MLFRSVAWRGRWERFVGGGDGSEAARNVFFARPKKLVPSFFGLVIALRFVGGGGEVAVVDVVEPDTARIRYWPACSVSDPLLPRLKNMLSELLLFLGALCW